MNPYTILFFIKFVLISLCALIGFEILKFAINGGAWWGGFLAILVWVMGPIIILEFDYPKTNKIKNKKSTPIGLINEYDTSKVSKTSNELNSNQTNNGIFKTSEEKTKFLNAMKKAAQDRVKKKEEEFLRAVNTPQFLQGVAKQLRQIEESKQRDVRNLIYQTITRPRIEGEELYKKVVRIISLIKNSTVTLNQYPTSLESTIQKAIELKRLSNYSDSLDIYFEIISNQKIVHTGVLNGLWKVIASAGYCREATQILKIGKIAMKGPEMALNTFGLPNTFEDHLERINNAIKDRLDLISYLRDISGNSNYILPRDYSDIVNDYYS
jgi:hypothetical protein